MYLSMRCHATLYPAIMSTSGAILLCFNCCNSLTKINVKAVVRYLFYAKVCVMNSLISTDVH